MPADRHRLPAEFRRRQLIHSFVPTNLMRVCQNCDKARSPEKCKVGGASNRCIECARKGRSCDLAPFSPARWARIREQKEEKKKKADEALACFMRYNKEVSALKKQEREMVEGELKNIDEVEADERLAAINPDDFLFNVSSKQIEIPSDFDWSGFAGDGEITIGGSGSSQGS